MSSRSPRPTVASLRCLPGGPSIDIRARRRASETSPAPAPGVRTSRCRCVPSCSWRNAHRARLLRWQGIMVFAFPVVRGREKMMADFYTTFLRNLPRDEWGHPILPTPDKIRRREYATRLLVLQIELVKMQQWARGKRRACAPALRGTRHGRQGRHDPTHARAHEPASSPAMSPFPLPTRRRADSGTSSDTSNSPRRVARSHSSIGPGTTEPASNAS